MIRRHASTQAPALLALLSFACQPGNPMPRAEVDASRQLIVAITPDWTSTVGTLTRFERATPTSTWTRLESPIPLVVGRTGLAWGVGFDDVSTEGPHKHEGDGKAPAGIFPLDTAFGFAPREMLIEVLAISPPIYDLVDARLKKQHREKSGDEDLQDVRRYLG